MEARGVRYESFKDDEIYALLKQKDELITQLKSMQAQINSLAEDGKVLAGKIQKIKDEAIPLLEKKKDDLELGEWEIVTSFQIEGDEVSAQITDLVEAEKERILVQREREKNEQSASSNTDAGDDTL